jgi:hypothetical protein
MSITPSPQQPPPFTMPPLMRGSSALSVAVGPPRPWLWQGYLAPRAVTLLTSSSTAMSCGKHGRQHEFESVKCAY